MLRSKALWYLMMAGAVAGWIFSLIGVVRPYRNERLNKLWKTVAFTWVFGHPLELFVSHGIGKAAGLPTVKIILKTLVFGITWWLPVKLGAIKG